MDQNLLAERLGYLVGPAIAAAVNLLLFAFLLARPPRQKTLRLVIPFSLCLALWNIGTLLVFAAPDESFARLAATWIYYPAVIILPPIFFQIIASFSGRKLSSAGLFAVYLPSLVLLVTIPTGHYVRSFYRYRFGYYANGNTLPHLAWIAWFTILFAAGLRDLFIAYRGDADPYRRNQTLFMTAALLLLGLGSSTNLIPLFGFEIYPVGNITNVIFVAALFWILTRYRLVDFPLFLGRITFSAIVLLGAVAADLLVLVFGRKLLSGSFHVSEPASTAFAATAAAMVAMLIYRSGQKSLSPRMRRWIFASRYDYGYDLLEWGRTLATELDSEKIGSMLARTLHESAGVLQGAIARFDETTSRFRIESAFGPGSETLKGTVVLIGPEASEWLAALDAPLFRQDVAEPAEGLSDSGRYALTSFLQKTEGVVLFPFVLQGRLRGALVLGPRAADSIYTYADVRPLRLLAQQAAISLENARLYSRLAESNASLRRASDELAELNRSLEEKVEDRTRELALANKKIQSADRLKSQFLANMSHELRTPLNSIIGFSEILLERLGPELAPKQQKFLANIHGSGQHLLGIINDLLDLSKIEAGKMEFYSEAFDVPQLIEGVRSVMRGVADNRKIDIQLDILPGIPRITSDAVKFKQVVYNLLSNAVKFSPEGSAVTIRVRQIRAEDPPLLAEGVAVDVIDRGIGIAAADQAVIFEEFRQADGGSTRQYGGTGLGLALVKRFLELQGGAIEVHSDPGEGSRFTAFLPLVAKVQTPDGETTEAPDPPGSPPRASDSSEPGSRVRVLVVEDDPIAYATLAAELEAEGYEAIRARHGEEALRIIDSETPDIILLDLILPGLDGWEVLKDVKSRAGTREIPVVIITMADDRELGLALGADDYFMKPVHRDLLVARLRELVQGEGKDRPGKVLLIDDDPKIHELFSEDIEKSGYQLISCYSGAEGIDSARSERPGVIVLDLMMPGMSGFEVAAALKADPVTALIPIVVLTAKEITPSDRNQLGSRIAALYHKGARSRAGLLDTIRNLTRRRGREMAGVQ